MRHGCDTTSKISFLKDYSKRITYLRRNGKRNYAFTVNKTKEWKNEEARKSYLRKEGRHISNSIGRNMNNKSGELYSSIMSETKKI